MPIAKHQTLYILQSNIVKVARIDKIINGCDVQYHMTINFHSKSHSPTKNIQFSWQMCTIINLQYEGFVVSKDWHFK